MATTSSLQHKIRQEFIKYIVEKLYGELMAIKLEEEWRYYLVQSFQPRLKDSYVHYMVGYEITDIVSSIGSLAAIESMEGNLSRIINSAKYAQINFSSHTEFFHYIPERR